MVDGIGQIDIRGIDIDKLARGFADEIIGLDVLMAESKTSAREMRWYQKTAGFFNAPTTTGMTTNLGENTDFGSRPAVVQNSFTRQTSYVRKYFVESEWIPVEDIADNDPDVVGHITKDLVRGILQRKNLRIWNILSENITPVNINEEAITNEWDDYANATPISDLTNAKAKIRAYGYNPEGATLLLNDNGHKYLLNWIVATKGSNMPTLSSSIAVGGRVTEFCGLNIMVDVNVTADYGMIVIPKTAGTWKTFAPLTTAKLYDEGIGYKIRAWIEGEGILHDPKAVCLLSNVGPS